MATMNLVVVMVVIACLPHSLWSIEVENMEGGWPAVKVKYPVSPPPMAAHPNSPLRGCFISLYIEWFLPDFSALRSPNAVIFFGKFNNLVQNRFNVVATHYLAIS